MNSEFAMHEFLFSKELTFFIRWVLTQYAKQMIVMEIATFARFFYNVENNKALIMLFLRTVQ